MPQKRFDETKKVNPRILHPAINLLTRGIIKYFIYDSPEVFVVEPDVCPEPALLGDLLVPFEADEGGEAHGGEHGRLGQGQRSGEDVWVHARGEVRPDLGVTNLAKESFLLVRTTLTFGRENRERQNMIDNMSQMDNAWKI